MTDLSGSVTAVSDLSSLSCITSARMPEGRGVVGAEGGAGEGLDGEETHLVQLDNNNIGD